MKHGVLYHAALQSAFGFGYAFNQQAGTGYKISKLTWTFYLDKTSVNSRARGIMLASTTTPIENIIRIKLSVTDTAFSEEEIRKPIAALTNHFEEAVNKAIGVLNSRVVQDGSWTKHGSVVEVEFIVDEQRQIQFTGFARDDKNSVIHTLKFTIRAA